MKKEEKLLNELREQLIALDVLEDRVYNLEQKLIADYQNEELIDRLENAEMDLLNQELKIDQTRKDIKKSREV